MRSGFCAFGLGAACPASCAGDPVHNHTALGCEAPECIDCPPSLCAENTTNATNATNRSSGPRYYYGDGDDWGCYDKCGINALVGGIIFFFGWFALS